LGAAEEVNRKEDDDGGEELLQERRHPGHSSAEETCDGVDRHATNGNGQSDYASALPEAVVGVEKAVRKKSTIGGDSTATGDRNKRVLASFYVKLYKIYILSLFNLCLRVWTDVLFYNGVTSYRLVFCICRRAATDFIGELRKTLVICADCCIT
jgi:hypothetical protein